MSTPNRPCTVDGSKMYYDIEDITEGKTVKGAFEAKFLIDAVEAIKGQCFAVHQHCKGLYPEVKGPEAGRKWLTSVDQDNDISLQQTLDKSDIPILYNTPRFCDPGITKSRNWGLKNYIQTRLYLYKRYLKNNSNSTIIRNSSKCYSSVVFDFRPFVFSMKLPVIQNATSGRQTEGKKLYFLQWMEIESGSEYGYKANTAIYDDVEQMNAQIKTQSSSVDFFKKLVMNYSKKGMAKKSATNIQKNDITITNNQLNGFMQFLVAYDGIKFGGNSNLNVKQQLKSITLTDDVLRMFYFDLMHDLAKGSQKFKKLTFIEFKENFMYEFRRLKGVHRVRGLAGAGTTATSYQTYETLIQKRNIGNMQEIPAIFKTIGDLSQYLYAAKYGTTVGSGDRMGIAVGLYVCAKIGIPVKTMIEDGITGFILYTGRKDVKLSGGSSCAKNNNAVNACSRNAKIAKSGNIITNTLNSTPRIAADIAAIEKRKPSTRRPKGMKGLMALWRNSASTMNAAGVAKIIEAYYVFDGYWSKNDLKKLLNIVQNIQARNNIKSNGEIGRKLNVLNGRIRGFLPNNGSPSRSGLKRTRSNVNNGGNAGTTPNRRNVKARRPTPTPPTNNSARRKTNLNAYITRLQNNLRNKGSNHNFNKNFWLNQLNGNENTNRRLEIIKNQVKGTYNVKIRELMRKRGRNNNGSRNGNGNVIMANGNGNGNGRNAKKTKTNGQGPNLSGALSG